MENKTYLLNSFTYGRESALRMTAGVAGNPTLAAGLLLGYLFLGVGSYIWTFMRRKRPQRGSLWGSPPARSLISLVFLDLVNGITAIILAVQFFESCSSAATCLYVYIVWFMSRSFATIFHLLSALVYVLILCHPQWEANVRYLQSAVVLVTVIIAPIYIYATQVGLMIMGIVTIGLALAIIAKCTASTANPSAAAQKKKIVLVSMITFFVVFMPTFVLECLVISDANNWQPTENYLIAYVNSLYFTNIQIFMDGILCYVTLLLSFNREEEQRERQHDLGNPNYSTSGNVTT